MDWKLLGISFAVVFLSELGDKSQFAAMTLSGQCQHPKAIFIGTASALIFTSFLGVILGQGVSQILPTTLLKAIAAVGFAILGLGLLWPNSAKGSIFKP
jgi:putative Ca2+/H+ antiporter (TMEM165/GDT1 family)